MKYYFNLFVFLLLSFNTFGSNPSLSHKIFLNSLRRLPSPETRCQVTFSLWQKDAYSDVGGRNQSHLPVHTSSFLQIICHKKLIAQVNKGNYGSQIGETDSQGINLLDLAYMDSMEMSLKEAMNFQTVFSQMSCLGYSEFLSYERLLEEFKFLFLEESFENQSRHIKEKATKFFVCNNEATLVRDLWMEYKSDRNLGLSRPDTWFNERCNKGPKLFFPIH